METLIRLGIAMDYPVHWDFARVLRDLIQNFYDSIGSERFGEEFEYRYDAVEIAPALFWFPPVEEYTLLMQTKGHDFDHEWLVYLGASTKTGRTGYVGQYGEGFKICMLSLLKMGITDVMMHSQNWRLTPCTYTEEIDGSTVSMLGYRYEVDERFRDGMTSLVLRKIPGENGAALKEGCLNFFYPSNPLFGDRIRGTDMYEVYQSSGMRIPSRQPEGLKGILYVNHLARGRLNIPLFININDPDREEETRERKVLIPLETMEYMYALAVVLDPVSSLWILEIMKEYWNDLPKRLMDGDTWYYVICQLVRNVAADWAAGRIFREMHKDLAYIERMNSDRRHNRRVEACTVWAAENSTKRRVNPIFRLLGAENLLESFEKQKDDFTPADAHQEALIKLLWQTLEEVLPERMAEDVRRLAEPAGICIGSGEASRQDPLAFAESVPVSGKGKGIHPRYRLQTLVFSEEDFAAAAFDRSFVSLADKALHIYGSSRSERVNDLFTELGGWILAHRDAVETCREKWRELAEAG